MASRWRGVASSASVLHGGRVFVARLFPVGDGSCAAGAKLASWNGPGGWQEHGGPWHRRQCLAGRGVFVASAFPVGRRIVRSGREVGQLERAGRMARAWRPVALSARVLQGGGVFVASVFPVGRRIVRSGREVGQLERQDDGGPWHRRPVSCRAARLRGVGFSLLGGGSCAAGAVSDIQGIQNF